MKCTIVSIANNKEITKGFLDNLKNQEEVDCQLIIIENQDHLFTSARAAYNSCLDRIDNEIVVFSHPDIRFLNHLALHNLIKQAASLGAFGVVGAAGCKSGKEWEIQSNIVHGRNKERAGSRINKPVEVQTVDECLFIMHKADIQKIKFTNLGGWHLYAVEQCLRMSTLEQKNNYVVPADLWHLSNGKSLDPSYMITLESMIRGYRSEYEYINTTVKQWKTKGLFSMSYRKYYWMKQFVKKRILSK